MLGSCSRHWQELSPCAKGGGLTPRESEWEAGQVKVQRPKHGSQGFQAAGPAEVDSHSA